MKPLLLVLNLVSGVDTATTHIAIKKYDAVERFYPTQNVWVIHGANLSQQLAYNWALPKMKNKKISKTIVVGLTAVRTYYTVNNIKQMINKG